MEVELPDCPPGDTDVYDPETETAAPGDEENGQESDLVTTHHNYPPVTGFIEEPITNLIQTDKLVFGAGAKRDSATLGQGLQKLSSDQAIMVQKAKKYAMEVSIKMVLMKQTLAHQQQQTKYLQRQQAISMMSRIYVGCINYDVREDSIKQAFLPFGPIRSITMSWDSMTGKHKGFAFVEFEQPEAAQLALEQMNGILVCSRNIKVGRPSQMPQAQACIDEIQKEARQHNRIYISSIHKDLSDEDIRSVFSAFGNIKFCDLASAGVPGRHKGYGYIEYDTLQSTTEAISSMNLFDLGGQYLRVGRAITPPDSRGNLGMAGTPTAMPSASAVAAAAATAKIQALEAVSTNLGVDASKLSIEKKKEEAKRKRSRSRERARVSPKREARSSPTKPVKQEQEVPGVKQEAVDVKHENGIKHDPDTQAAQAAQAAPPVQPIQTPPTIPAESFSQPTMGGAVGAQGKAQQIELEKKLMDQGEPATLKQQEDMSIKGKSARHMVMQRLMGSRAKVESVVLVLRNMVTHEEVDESLQEEIEEECNKYGKVENVIIYQERQSEEEDAEIQVKIFVEFSKHEEVKQAKAALDGRFFGGKTVSAIVYDQELYDQQDFSG